MLMSRFFIYLMDTWAIGLAVCVGLSLANAVFTLRFARFFGQLQVSVIWPLALMSPNGRKVLAQIFKDTFTTKGNDV